MRWWCSNYDQCVFDPVPPHHFTTINLRFLIYISSDGDEEPMWGASIVTPQHQTLEIILFLFSLVLLLTLLCILMLPEAAAAAADLDDDDDDRRNLIKVFLMDICLLFVVNKHNKFFNCWMKYLIFIIKRRIEIMQLLLHSKIHHKKIPLISFNWWNKGRGKFN